MEQVSSRFGRTVADMNGSEQDRGRLLRRLALCLGIAALLSTSVQIVLWLLGMIIALWKQAAVAVVKFREGLRIATLQARHQFRIARRALDRH